VDPERSHLRYRACINSERGERQGAYTNVIIPLNGSACFLKSNGLAEAVVKSVKYLFQKSDNYSDFDFFCMRCKVYHRLGTLYLLLKKKLIADSVLKCQL
jgi:hypothetical protein